MRAARQQRRAAAEGMNCRDPRTDLVSASASTWLQDFALMRQDRGPEALLRYDKARGPLLWQWIRDSTPTDRRSPLTPRPSGLPRGGVPNDLAHSSRRG